MLFYTMRESAACADHALENLTAEPGTFHSIPFLVFGCLKLAQIREAVTTGDMLERRRARHGDVPGGDQPSPLARRLVGLSWMIAKLHQSGVQGRCFKVSTEDAPRWSRFPRGETNSLLDDPRVLDSDGHIRLELYSCNVVTSVRLVKCR